MGMTRIRSRLVRACLAILLAAGAGEAHAATVTVDTLADTVDGIVTSIGGLLLGKGLDGKISLREALTAANNTAGADTIDFSVSGTINVTLTELPALSGGETSILGGGSIALNGEGLASGNGIRVTSGSNLVSGLSIGGFPGDGVVVSGAAALDNTIVECTIGGANGNGDDGVAVASGAQNTWIGQPGQPNVIRGNTGDGIQITGANTLGTWITNCFIGLDAAGELSANGGSGVNINNGSDGTLIGGTAPDQSNIISGNTEYGVRISGAGVTFHLVRGNIIGAGSSGLTAKPNGLAGVLIEAGATNNEVGGTELNTGNLISGNGGEGVLITGEGTDNNRVRNNRIGLRVLGTSALPNGTAGDIENGDGVRIESGASDNVIGAEDARNEISGNADDGIEVRGIGSFGNRVTSNYIGTGTEGLSAVPNDGDGVYVTAEAEETDIGNDIAAQGNLISGNLAAGVRLEGVTGTKIRNNIIGLDITGEIAIPNAAGIVLELSASANTIGQPGRRNTVSGNTSHGIELDGTSVIGNVLQDNRIGTNLAGTAAVPNGGSGVRLANGASSNTLGGDADSEGNVISGNGGSGVLIENTSTQGNVLEGNTIGAGMDGVTPLGNTGDGVRINAAALNVIGGAVAAGNLIANNGGDGIEVTGATATGNSIRRNRITANSSGLANRGIVLTTGGNGGITAPNVLLADPIGGTAQPNAEVDIFADDEDQGAIYIATVTASGDGTFTSNADVEPYEGMNITATVTGPGGNTSAFGANAAVPDMTPPEITLLGDNTVTVECGGLVAGSGVQAVDNVDGDITPEVVVTVQGTTLINALATPGNYTLRYNVSDNAGNAATQVTRPLVVADTLAPELALIGDTERTIGCFDEYVDAGATATDQCDDDVEITVSAVDTTVPGEQTVSITATDDEGNTAEATRTLTVLGALTPEIFVAVDGDDASGRGTELAPFATVTYAMDQARCIASAVNPVTIHLGAGAYPEIIEFAEYTTLSGAGMDTTIIAPSAGDIGATNGPFVVNTGAFTAMNNLGIVLPLGAPSGTRMVSVISVVHTLDHVALDGSQVSGSSGVYLRGNDSSASTIRDCRIGSVTVGLDIAFSAARVAFSDFENINGGTAIKIAPNTGEPPVVGDLDSLVSTGSNIFRNITNGFLVQSDNTGGTTRAQANSWENQRVLNAIIARFGGVRPDLVDAKFPLFSLPATKGDIQPQLFVTVLDGETDLPVSGVALTLNANERAELPEAGSTGVYTALVSKGQYTLRAQKPGYDETVDYVVIGQGINNVTMVLGEGGVGTHSADTDGDDRIGLSELLRVIQLYNVGAGFSCGTGDDGFQLGISGGQQCPAHAADYAGGPNWKFSLSELLRVVQFFNLGGLGYCPGETEDNFCPE